MPVVLFSNLKGGVAKTTNAVAVAECLAFHGKSTLVIDADHQCTASELLLGESRLDSLERRRRTVNDLFLDMLKPSFERKRFEYYVAGNASNIAGGLERLSVIPCSVRINDVQSKHNRVDGRFEEWKSKKERFAKHVKQLKQWANSQYDFTIVDCPPSLAFQVKQFFKTSDAFIVPCQPNRLSVRGADWLCKKLHNDNFRRLALGTLWSMCRRKDRWHQAIVSEAADGVINFGPASTPLEIPKPFNTTIPLTVNIAHAVEETQAIPSTLRAKYGPEYAAIFVALAGEILSRLSDAGLETSAELWDADAEAAC
ncbi:MAG: AAA family ATPase [Planctomycetota bacterium]